MAPFTPDELTAFYDRLEQLRASGDMRTAREALLDQLPRLPALVQTEILAALVSETIDSLVLRRDVQRVGISAAQTLQEASKRGRANR